MQISSSTIRFFEKRIADFYRKAGRKHLLWRKRKITAYEVWVSEVMLQQTQVTRVISYYERFLKRFPTIQKLAEASWEEFLPFYQGLGYYTRGRNMLETARKVAKEYGGKFPREKKLLEVLPGIGPYTAAAIMSFAYGDNHLAWDTNLKRVIGRFFFGGKQRVPDENFWKDKLHSSKRELNAALMDFGSALCVSRPKCEACALKRRCAYYREKGNQESGIRNQVSGIKEKKRNWREARVVLFLHENHRKYYSSDKGAFKPFILSSGYNTRAGIKKYFQEKYGLLLSVRPPYKKSVMGGKPTLLVNAQILLGKPIFKVFSKNEVERYNTSVLNSQSL